MNWNDQQFFVTQVIMLAAWRHMHTSRSAYNGAWSTHPFLLNIFKKITYWKKKLTRTTVTSRSTNNIAVHIVSYFHIIVAHISAFEKKW